MAKTCDRCGDPMGDAEYFGCRGLCASCAKETMQQASEERKTRKAVAGQIDAIWDETTRDYRLTANSRTYRTTDGATWTDAATGADAGPLPDLPEIRLVGGPNHMTFCTAD